MDFQTQFKLHGYKFSAIQQLDPVSTLRDNYREIAPHVFQNERPQVHDCRAEAVKSFSENTAWEAYQLSHGLREVVEAADLQYSKDEEQEVASNKAQPPDKLLYMVGKKPGNKKKQFRYPRGLAISGEGHIYIADTMNHRIQKFNQCGVFLGQFGSKGEWNGEFNEPSAVALTMDGDLAVADRKNKRIQVLETNGQQLFEFATKDEPYGVSCDENCGIIVSTTKGTVEVYQGATGDLQASFSVVDGSTGSLNPRPIAVTDDEEVLVCDTTASKIKVYDYTGKFLRDFEVATRTGLSFQPTTMDVDPLGHIIIGDGLNHGIHLFSQTGHYMKELVGVADRVGAVQALRVGPEGHLVDLEFTSNGNHCAKILRYGICDCHPISPVNILRSMATTPMTS